MPQQRRAKRHPFWRRLRWTLPLSLGLWLLVRPAYNTFLTFAVEKLCRFWENPPATRVVVEEEKAVIGRDDMRTGSGWLGYSLTQIHFNFIPTLALILALPGWNRNGGWEKLVWAMLLLETSHVLTLLWHVQFFFATSLGPWSEATYGPVSRNLLGILRYLFDIPLAFTLPLLLWASFFWDQVAELLGLSGGDGRRRP